MISITLEQQNIVDIANQFETGRVKVTVTYSPVETERWVRRNLTALPKNVESWIVGLDTESDPRKTDGVTVMQLATYNSILVYCIPDICRSSPTNFGPAHPLLREALARKDIVKIGFNMSGEVRLFRDVFGVKVGPVKELADRYGRGLSDTLKKFGIIYDKRQGEVNLMRRSFVRGMDSLSQQQIVYAALDAWLPCLVGLRKYTPETLHLIRSCAQEADKSTVEESCESSEAAEWSSVANEVPNEEIW
ncbi:MAG: uncharacterized protein KVP18_003533 [Porospora cf. gigantea A]|uniref:uncharacterized protein n=1 Tax=Porospora cf. gigantea A TaxID=2853593 RepID=UPI00355A6ABC|nr:MAG: hypothetical protein KVP18_003533 [Porospora cf. gigantea A]